MPFRVFWTPGKPWSWFRDEPATLAKYVERAGGTDCFHTLNMWDKPEQGPCHYDFGFDFDSSDIRVSATDANTVIEYLAAMDCPYRIYFSGSKGIHIVIPHEVTGLPARADGGHVCKLFQRALKDTLAVKTLDTEIHGVSRQWRVPGTINSKSGLYKVPLSLNWLGALVSYGLDTAREIASTPVPDKELLNRNVCAELNKRLQPFCTLADEENRKREELNKQRIETQIKTVPLCISQIMNAPQRVVQQAKSWGKKVPSRNQLTFVVATFLKNHAGASSEDALKVLGPIWQAKVASIATSSALEIKRSTETCVRTVYQGAYNFSCGMAIGYGCDCHPKCPLYIPLAEADKKKGRG